MPPTRPLPPRGRTAQPPRRPDGSIATSPPASSEFGDNDRRAEIYTLFTTTSPSAKVIYTADRKWAKVTLTLDSAGPVVVSTSARFSLTDGQGIPLANGVPVSFNLAKANRLYYVASSVNRVKVVIEPYPWLEQIVGMFNSLLSRFMP